MHTACILLESAELFYWHLGSELQASAARQIKMEACKSAHKYRYPTSKLSKLASRGIILRLIYHTTVLLSPQSSAPSRWGTLTAERFSMCILGAQPSRSSLRISCLGLLVVR